MSRFTTNRSRTANAVARKKHPAPCKECSDRVSGCHSTCQKYIEYKQNFESAKKETFQALKQSALADDYTTAAHVERCKRYDEWKRRYNRQWKD